MPDAPAAPRPKRSSSLRRLLSKVRPPSLASFSAAKLPEATSPKTAANLLAAAPEAAGGPPLPGVTWPELASERSAVGTLRAHLSDHCKSLRALRADASTLVEPMGAADADLLELKCVEPLDILLADMDALVDLGHARAAMLIAIATYENEVASPVEADSSGSDEALRRAVNKYCLMEKDVQRRMTTVAEHFDQQALADKRRIVDMVLATWQQLERTAGGPAPDLSLTAHAKPSKLASPTESPVSSVLTIDDWSIDASFGLAAPSDLDDERHVESQTQGSGQLQTDEVKVVFERGGRALDDLKVANDRANEGLNNLVTLNF